MSNKQKILFRVDSSSSIGLGHIMRSLVLASQYKDSLITFASQDLEGNANYKILENGYNLEILQSNKKEELVKLIKSLTIELLIIDNYQITHKEEKYIKKHTGVKILCFDDTYEKHHCDILLNHNISADSSKYEALVPKDCELRCGGEFTLLREEFYTQKAKHQIQKNSNIKNIFLSMGGSDSTNLNLKILKILSHFENIKVNLITTSSNQNLKALQKYSDKREWIHLHRDSTQIAKLMGESDFAIIPPSVTANEIYFLEIPFIAIKTAPNQDDIYNYLKNNNYSTLKKFDEKKLQKMIQKKLDSLSLTLRELQTDDKDFLFELVNDSLVRENSLNSEIITYENHSLWFEKKLQEIQNNLSKIYILTINDTKIAQIRLDKQAMFWIVDISIDKEYRNKGYAQKMVKLLLSKLQDEILFAHVKTTNIASQKLFKNAGFVKLRESFGVAYFKYKVGENNG